MKESLSLSNNIACSHCHLEFTNALEVNGVPQGGTKGPTATADAAVCDYDTLVGLTLHFSFGILYS